MVRVLYKQKYKVLNKKTTSTLDHNGSIALYSRTFFCNESATLRRLLFIISIAGRKKNYIKYINHLRRMLFLCTLFFLGMT